ncbi:MAG TPA: hypothetical protein VMF91_22940 [Bryobacteraceae bacterium]|nr:hypothetical protein [Bryobacteraceae bacterium]
MASDGDGPPRVSRLNSVDRRGRQIGPKVLAAAEAVFERALNHGMDTLGDPAVVANTLEEIAATVSKQLAVREAAAESAPIRNLPGYIFRAYARQVNRLKHKEVALLNAVTAERVLDRTSADPSRQLEMQILLQEYLARFDFVEKDMCWRRLEGDTWEEVGKVHGISAHTAEVRLLDAVRRVRAELAKIKRKKSLLSATRTDQNKGTNRAMRTDAKKKSSPA